MKTKMHPSWKKGLLVLSLAGFVGMAFAEDDGKPFTRDLSPEVIAAQAADDDYLAALEVVAANRAGTINGLVSQWEPVATSLGYTGGWSAEFIAMLEATSDAQLLALQSASNYDEVRAILQGRTTAATIDGISGPEELGDLTEDLTYTPVVPCRIFDTRFDIFGGPGGGNPGTQLDYYVYGSAALLAPQGHTAGTGCNSPKGEPVAIAANFTVVPYGKGHIRAWPYLSAQPNASFLNYNSTVNSNLANAGIVATCYGCGLDMSVSTWFGSSDSLADVMGYFYPAQQVIPAGAATTTLTTLTSTCTNLETVTITVPPGGGYVTVTATVNMSVDKDAGVTEWAEIYLGTSSSDCTTIDSADGYVSQYWQLPPEQAGTVNLWYFQEMSVQRRFPASAGTRTYYLNGRGTDGTATDNVSARDRSMIATYSAY